MNDGFCIAIGANHFYMCKNNERYVRADVQARLAKIGTNSGNVVHSNVVHTIGISKPDHVFGQVLLAWISGALVCRI